MRALRCADTLQQKHAGHTRAHLSATKIDRGGSVVAVPIDHGLQCDTPHGQHPRRHLRVRVGQSVCALVRLRV